MIFIKYIGQLLKNLFKNNYCYKSSMGYKCKHTVYINGKKECD